MARHGSSALKLLGVKRFRSFLNYFARDNNSYVIDGYWEAIDGDPSLKSLFTKDSESGLTLKVEKMDDLVFKIYLGWHPSPMVGDGIEAIASFSQKGDLLELSDLMLIIV